MCIYVDILWIMVSSLMFVEKSAASLSPWTLRFREETSALWFYNFLTWLENTPYGITIKFCASAIGRNVVAHVQQHI